MRQKALEKSVGSSWSSQRRLLVHAEKEPTTSTDGLTAHKAEHRSVDPFDRSRSVSGDSWKRGIQCSGLSAARWLQVRVIIVRSCSRQ